MAQLIAAAPTIGTYLGYASFAYGVYQWLTAPDQVEPKLDTLQLQTAAYGVPIPELIGRDRIGGICFWTTDLIPKEHEQSGKGGPSIITYTYRASFAVKICKGPIAGYRRVWFDSVLVYDVGDQGGKKSNVATVEGGLDMTFYLGTDDQQPDPTIVADKGVGNVSAHPGDAYIVVSNLLLTKWGNKRPNISAEPIELGAVDQTVGCIIPMSTTKPEGEAFHAYTVWDGDLLTTTWFGYSNTGAGGMDGIAEEQWDIDADDPTVPVSYQHLATSVPNLPNVSQQQVVGDRPGQLAWTGPQGIDNNVYLFPGSRKLSYPAHNGQLQSNVLQLGEDVYYCVFVDPAGQIAGAVHLRHDKDYGSGTLLAQASLDFDVIPGGTDQETRLYGHKDSNYIAAALATNSPFAAGHHVTFLDRSLNPVSRFIIPVSFDAILGVADDALYIHASSGFVIAYSIPDGIQTLYLPIDQTCGSSDGWRANHMITKTMAQVGSSIWYLAGAFIPEKVTLASAVTKICGLCNIEPSQLDVSDLESVLIDGGAINDQKTGEQALQAYAAAYFLDMFPLDGKLHFVRANKAPIWTMADGDLVDDVEITRLQELELPTKVTVQYRAGQADYQQGSQEYNYPDTISTQKRAVDLKLVLEDDYAAQIAEISWAVSRVARLGFKWSVTHLFRAVKPGDGVDLTWDGDTYQVKITRVGTAVPGKISLEGSYYDLQAYVSYAKGGQTGVPTVVPGAAQTGVLVADAPAMVVDHDYPGIYVFAWGSTSAWPGVTIMKSFDQGQSWQAEGDIVSQAKTGVCQSVLDDRFLNVVDGGSLDVFMDRGVLLSSVTRDQMLAGQNSALVGQEGRWEVISFQTATDIGGGLQRISNLRRGRLGTEQRVGSHEVGDRFVLLDGVGMRRVRLDPAQLGAEIFIAAVPQGETMDSALQRVIEPTEMGVRPYAPTHLRLWYDASNLKWLFEWQRRARISGPLRNYGTPPLRDVPERYEVQQHRAGQPPTILNSSVPGVWLDSVQSGDMLTVQQVSPDVGAGAIAHLMIP